MSIYKDASLVMIPSAYKDGKLYSIRPTDGSGDFTFSRGSNLAATRVDVNGLIEKGRENVFLRSNEFNLTWNTYNTSRTSGAADFDGNNNAWTLAKTGSYGLINQYIANTGVHTFSIYVKSGSLDWVALTTSQAPYSAAYFDLANGVVGSLVNAIDSNIESVGGGWYRCSLTSNVTAAGNWRIYPADSDGGLTNANLGDIIIYKSQLEQGLVATDYIETGTSAAQSGILEDMPRLDYSGGASCPSLLLEPQRTNADPNAEYLANKPIVTNVSVTTNSTTSPEGVVNASTITNNTTNGQHQLTDNTFSVTSGTDYTISLFLKYNDAQYIRLQFGGTSFGSTNWQNFDVQNGTKGSSGGGITSADTSIEDYGNGWYRCIVTADATATGSNGAFQIRILEDDNTNHIPSFAGSGLSTYAWGAQFEQGSYPTSYIPTYGTSQTRSADDCQVDDLQSNGIVDTNWTYFFEWGKYVADRNFEIKNSLSTAFLFMVARMFRYNNAFGGVSTLTSLPSGANEGIKVAVRYDGSSLKVFRSDGITNEVTDMNTSLFGDFDFLRLDRAFDDSEEFKQLLIFPTALTDSECIALTTL